MASKQKTGRRKIKVEKITDERARQATFQKRKQGLIKKAMELSLLCEAEVALVIFGAPTATSKSGKLTQYSSRDIDLVLTKFVDATPNEVFTNVDYDKFGQKDKKDDDDSSRVASSECQDQVVNLQRALDQLSGRKPDEPAPAPDAKKRRVESAPAALPPQPAAAAIPRTDSDSFNMLDGAGLSLLESPKGSEIRRHGSGGWGLGSSTNLPLFSTSGSLSPRSFPTLRSRG